RGGRKRLDVHVGFHRLTRVGHKLWVDIAQAVVLERGHEAERRADLLPKGQDLTRRRGAPLKLLQALDMQVDRLLGVEIDVLQALHQTLHHALADFRFVLRRGPLAGKNDAVHLHAVVLVEHRVDVDLVCPECGRDTAEEIADDLDLLVSSRAHEPGWVHADDIDLFGIDSGRLDEGRPKLELTSTGDESDRLPLEVLRLGEIELLEREDADGGSWPHPRNGSEVQAFAGASRHHGQIEQPEVVLSLIDRHANLGRTKAAVDRNVYAPLLEVSEAFCDKDIAVGSERQPRQGELHQGRGRDLPDREVGCCGGAESSQTSDEPSPLQVHGSLPFVRVTGCRARLGPPKQCKGVNRTARWSAGLEWDCQMISPGIALDALTVPLLP